MKKKHLVAFDFDGTLYPLVPYDSEQRLVLSNAKGRGHLNRLRAKRMVQKDSEGRMDLGEFNRRYYDLLGGCTPDLVQEVAEDLFALVDPAQFALMEALAKKADLVILSCGTENIIHSFLTLHKIEHLFVQVSGKELHFTNSVKPDISVTIGSPQEKREVFVDLKSKYDLSIAVGDGPTDIPMLEEANLGLIIDWSGEKGRYPFETFSDLDSTLIRCLAYLDKVEEA